MSLDKDETLLQYLKQVASLYRNKKKAELDTKISRLLIGRTKGAEDAFHNSKDAMIAILAAADAYLKENPRGDQATTAAVIKFLATYMLADKHIEEEAYAPGLMSIGSGDQDE